METPAPATAPILVLGLGNTLLSDDGLGPVLVEHVRKLHRDTTTVECLDGGTQGLALLGRLAGRRALVILDAFALGKIPGTVTVLEGVDVLRNGGPRSTTAHEGNAGELLAAAQLLGDLPDRVILVGIEPGCVRTGLGLSETVAMAIPEAVRRVGGVLERLLAWLEEPASKCAC